MNILDIILNTNKDIKDEYKGCISVSKLCDCIKVKFNKEETAKKCAEKAKDNPDYKYYGMNAEQILESWNNKSNESKHYGCLVDDYAGLLFENKIEEIDIWKTDNGYEYDNRLKSTCIGVDQFYKFITEKTNYKYVGRELPMYCKTNKGTLINGRLDCLFYDENTNAFIIIDWKTTENITTKNKYGKRLLGPAYMLDECDMNLYTIQLHIYKKALVETYKLTDYNKISVYVCNLLRDPENNLYYKLFKQNFEFDINKLDSFIEFGNNKYKILKNLEN